MMVTSNDLGNDYKLSRRFEATMIKPTKTLCPHCNGILPDLAVSTKHKPKDWSEPTRKYKCNYDATSWSPDRSQCEWDDDDVCIHCGVSVSF